MITWKANGEKVMAKMGYTFEFLEFQLVRITRHKKMIVRIGPDHQVTVPVRVNRLTFVDSSGTEYNTYLDKVKFVLPDFVTPVSNVYKLMNIGEGDYIDAT